jgi:transposase-like protein
VLEDIFHQIFVQYIVNQLYGNGFRLWFVYQRVSLRLPYKSIEQMTKDVFNENLDATTIVKCVKTVSRSYVETEKILIRQILKNPFIHVDETKVNIQGINWKQTNMPIPREVISQVSVFGRD